MSTRLQLTKANSTKAERRAAQQDSANKKNNKRKRQAGPQPPRKRRGPRRRNAPHPFMVCRLNPFASKGSLGIPDGSQTRKLVVDHRLTTNLRFGSSGTIGIMFVPALPSFVWIYPFDNTTYVNGLPVLYNSNAGFVVPVVCAEWYNQAITYRNTAGNYDDVVLPYAADKARIVSGAWQLMYAGTSLNNAGMIRVNAGSFSLGAAVPNAQTFWMADYDTNQSLGYNTSQILTRAPNTEVGAGLFTLSSSSAETVLQRLSTGAHGLLKHSGKEYEFKEVSHNLVLVSKQSDENRGMLLCRGTAVQPTIVADHGLTQFFDEEWDTTFIAVIGGIEGQSIILDTILCVEYMPSPGSSVYALAKSGQPLNQRVLNAVEAAAGKQPVATGGMFSTLAGVASTAAEIGSVAASVAGLVL